MLLLFIDNWHYCIPLMWYLWHAWDSKWYSRWAEPVSTAYEGLKLIKKNCRAIKVWTRRKSVYIIQIIAQWSAAVNPFVRNDTLAHHWRVFPRLQKPIHSFHTQSYGRSFVYTFLQNISAFKLYWVAGNLTSSSIGVFVFPKLINRLIGMLLVGTWTICISTKSSCKSRYRKFE